MATASITEFSHLSLDSQGNVVAVGNLSNIVADGTVTYTTATSHALNQKTRFVRVICDADAHIAEGAAPTATASNARLEANVAEYFGVQDKANTGRSLSFYDGTS